MRIAVLFDGAGLARLGLEQAGHECVGVEIDPVKHYLSQYVGSGNCVLADARDFLLVGFDAVWASPPCQQRSRARTQGTPNRRGLHSREYSEKLSEDLVDWCLAIDKKPLWVENVIQPGVPPFGKLWNACQFLEKPIQNRNRIVGGNYRDPKVWREYTRAYPGICPCITATEYRGCRTDKRRAGRYYGRKLTIGECAYHQGFEIPEAWWTPMPGFKGTAVQWGYHLYEAIGNGVPVYMAKAFGEVYG